MYVTDDQFEFPIYIEESITDLSQRLGKTELAIRSAVCHAERKKEPIQACKEMKRQRGNIKAQKERRKERAKSYPKVKPGATEILIDGNYSQYAVAFCNYHKGWLTYPLMNTHGCLDRECSWLEEERMKENETVYQGDGNRKK